MPFKLPALSVIGKKLGLSKWIGGALSGVGNLFGGYLSGERALDAAQLGYEQQKEFAQNSISWRMADAERSGVHPLYALGAQPAQFMPMSISDGMGGGIAQGIDQLGRTIEDALMDNPTPGQIRGTIAEREAAELRAANVQVRKISAEAALTESLAAESAQRRTINQMQIDKGIPALSEAAGGNANPDFAPTKTVPNEIVAGRPGYPYLAAGIKPLFDEYHAPNNFKVLLPQGSNASEALEALESGLVSGAVIAANVAHYGPQWFTEFQKRRSKGAPPVYAPPGMEHMLMMGP